MFSIGLAPARHPNALESSCWSARYPPPGRRAHQLLISRSRILLVLYQSEDLSLPHRSKRIGLPLLHIDGRVPRMRVLTIWRNHRADDVLAGRQIAIAIVTFAQVRHFGTIDRD